MTPRAVVVVLWCWLAVLWASLALGQPPRAPVVRCRDADVHRGDTCTGEVAGCRLELRAAGTSRDPEAARGELLVWAYCGGER